MNTCEEDAGTTGPLTLMDLPDELLRCVLAQCTGPRRDFALAINRRALFERGSLLRAGETCQALKALSHWDALWASHLEDIWSNKRTPHHGWRRWWMCDVCRAGGMAQLAMPSPLCETVHLTPLYELSYLQSCRESLVRLTNNEITNEELCGQPWLIMFSRADTCSAVVFHRDGSFEDGKVFRRVNGRPGVPPQRWAVRSGPAALAGTPAIDAIHGGDAANAAMFVDLLPEGAVHEVRRSEDGGWMIENQYVSMYNFEGPRCRINGIALPLSVHLPPRVNGCVVTGLVARPGLNGRPCAIEGYDEGRARYQVRLYGDESMRGLPRGLLREAAAPKPPRLEERGGDGTPEYHVVHDGVVMLLRRANVVLPRGVRVRVVGSSATSLPPDCREIEGRISASPIADPPDAATAIADRLQSCAVTPEDWSRTDPWRDASLGASGGCVPLNEGSDGAAADVYEWYALVRGCDGAGLRVERIGGIPLGDVLVSL